MLYIYWILTIGAVIIVTGLNEAWDRRSWNHHAKQVQPSVELLPLPPAPSSDWLLNDNQHSLRSQIVDSHQGG